MKNITYKIRKHTTGLFGFLVFSFMFISFSSVMATSFESTFQRVMPTSYWYEYESVTPEKESFSFSEEPRFITDAVFHREIQMEWNDSLFCKRPQGLVKLPTQIWKEYVYPRNESNKGSWAYSEEKLTPEDSSCRMCGTIVGITSKGKKKTDSYCTVWFEVTS